MRESLKNMCDSFIKNRDTIKNVFALGSQYIIPVCASELCGKNLLVTTEQLNNCKHIVKNQTGVLSNFRGHVEIPMATALATTDKPDDKMKKAVDMYAILKKHFWGSEYLALVAAILADMISVDETEDVAVRGKRIYEAMKKEHPFLTSSEDSVFAVLMTFAGKEDQELIADMEACYTILKKSFTIGDSLQALSQVLTLAEGTPEEKCERVLSIYHGLQKAGRKYGKSNELSVLGALSMQSVDVNAIVEDIIQVDDFLATQKGYGVLGIEKKIRLMHAAMLVSNIYAQDNNSNTAAITGTIAMVAAQEAAMCAVIAASAAASTASTN